jgi:DNA-binding response OmpR family regulator
MQSLLISEDFHQGQFVQQGLKYENVPNVLLSAQTHGQDLVRSIESCDNIFLLIQRIETIDEVLAKINDFSRRVPIIVLAQRFDSRLLEYAKNQKIDQVFIRPFPFRVVANEARMLVYRQREPSAYGILKVRDLELHRDTHEVRCKNQTIHLRHKEFILLEFLMLNAGKLLSRDKILESVWDRNANIFTNTVDVHINKLRKKIDYPVRDKFIHTVHCSGYIFS